MTSMWGEEHDNKTAEFNRQVELIEAKHEHIFANQINPLTGKPPAKLAYQFLTTYDGYKNTFGFRKETYVPKHVQDEVTEAFRSVFSKE